MQRANYEQYGNHFIEHVKQPETLQWEDDVFHHELSFGSYFK